MKKTKKTTEMLELIGNIVKQLLQLLLGQLTRGMTELASNDHVRKIQMHLEVKTKSNGKLSTRTR